MALGSQRALQPYLRVAQKYMLISMLTGTSTILGLFQAMIVLLKNRKRYCCGRGQAEALRKGPQSIRMIESAYRLELG
jgi:hypothetical protein